MLDSVYHVTLNIFEIAYWRENGRFCHVYMTLRYITLSINYHIHSGIEIITCTLSH